MSKKIIETITKALPSFFNNAIDYLKDNFEKNGQEILKKTGGTAGLIVNIFAQPLIDKYFESIKEKRLENFGFKTYLKSSLLQANESLLEIKEKLDDSYSSNLVFDILNKSLKEEIVDFNKNDAILIYQPKYHPAIAFVRKNYQRILRELNVNQIDIKEFIKHFNENIEATVSKEFGEDYEQHLKETEIFRLKDNETRFLWDTVQQGRIGFKETEDLRYEATYAEWKRVKNLRDKDEEDLVDEEDKVQKREKALTPIETLIEEYFSRSPNNHLESILFIIADFGKGKSVFMKHYAANLAKNYLETAQGFFPIYFNLRDFKNYSSEPRLGVISDYLETRYSIKIDDEYFQKKRYAFLVDSLDESGELTKHAIDKVIDSIKSIQGINKTKYKNNRIIITSRPFDEGLSYHLNEHDAFTTKNQENRDIPNFINIYGFTKTQFNDWLFETLKTFKNLDKIKAAGFAKKIIDSIKLNKKIDIHEQLLDNETLSFSEIRRPIFAYMIYQLIINDVDFLAVGKLGVYLSFLNLLTKEAKHIHDVNYKVNLKEEFEFRNVLHATASLWMYERQRGKQGMLMKADICRVLEGKDSNESDSEVLERFKGQGLTEIQFLSHSYFGENDNVLHFQHQSFAEILLAEYYLKVFIKFALDDDSDTEEARVKLVLGEPTEQTILFFNEMLRLLRETATDVVTKEVIEKRKLLFPLMASLATNKHTRLFCNDIYYSWYLRCDIDENQTEYPLKSLENWCIDKIRLDKIIGLSTDIINSKTTYLPTRANSKTALFNTEVLEFKNQELGRLTPNIDRWLALLVGNLLYNEITPNEELKLFNWSHKINFYCLFEMLKSWNYAFNISAPNWGKDLFIGIDMRSNMSTLDLSFYNFDGINFSYSFLKGISCWCTNWSRGILDNCSFDEVRFITSLFYTTSIQNIKEIKNEFYMVNCDANSNGIKLLDSFRQIKGKKFFYEHHYESKTTQLIRKVDIEEDLGILVTLSGLMIYGLQKSYFKIINIKDWFTFEDDEIKAMFYKFINTLKIYEIKRNRASKSK